MTLTVLGSSSSGNCYLLQSSATGEVLILEAGIPISKVKKALDFNLSKVVACLITHEHGDHAKHARKLHDCLIPIVCTSGTAAAIGLQDSHWCPTSGHALRFGDFRVMAFPVRHDAKEPCGFLIHHPECGTVLFATDTYYLPNTFAGLNNILLECNYRLDILDANIRAGIVHPRVRDRIIRSHMSYHTCAETLAANDLSQVNNIVLVHLSSDNSHADDFRNGIAAITEHNVTIATRGLTMDFNKTPY